MGVADSGPGLDPALNQEINAGHGLDLAQREFRPEGILTPLSTSSGESLEESVAHTKLGHEHTETGGLLIGGWSRWPRSPASRGG